MTIFDSLRLVNAFITRLPGLDNPKDFEIVVEVGCHQARGTPLSQKQLSLLGIAPDATIRRRVERLVRLGIIIKYTPSNDHRTTQLLLAPKTTTLLDSCLRALHENLCTTSEDCNRE